jgi:tetratricopeptide (TPR) repeat protein
VPCFKENFSYIIEKDTANHNALNYLGYSLIDRNMELDKAIDMVKKALSYDPDNPAYLDSLAWGYYRKGDYKEALAAILKSIEKMDYDSIVWEHLGHIYLKLGDFDNAWFSFQLSNDLNNQEKNIKLAYDLKDKVNFQKAIERYFSLISLKKASFVSNGELSIKFSGRRISADMVISNKPGEYFFVSILDPLMSPMWSVKYTTSSVHYSNISGDLAYGEYLNLTLNRISDLLKDIYGGGIYDLPYGNIKNRVLENGDYKIKLNKDKNRIESIVYKKGGEKIKVYFKNYDFISNYLFPVEVVIKSDKLTFTIKLPKNKIEVKNINKLAL